MSALLLAPHADDETLFAAYTCMREQPHVVICTYRQESDAETVYALGELGCDFTQLVFAEGALEKRSLTRWLDLNKEFSFEGDPDVVYAPAYHVVGHEEHNIASLAALDAFGDRVQYYLTYAPRGQRSRNGTLVNPEPWMIPAKLRALAHYESQIANPATRPWFHALLDMREWMA